MRMSRASGRALVLGLAFAGLATTLVARQTLKKGGDPEAAKMKNPVAATPA